MKSTVLFDDGNHRCLVMGRDPSIREDVIDTNQFLIVSGGKGFLVDPGGIEVFPQVLTEISHHVKIGDIETIFATHQDPDIISSLSLWSDLVPGLKVHCSWLWTSFITHFCMGTRAEIIAVPDEGAEIPVGPRQAMLEAIPAHYCHASGNFSIWDPHSRVLFSGDIGAALLPSRDSSLFVEDFEQHTRYMEGFHKRWMPSEKAIRAWVRRVRELDPEQICPQHGSVFRGEDVRLFLDWLEALEIDVFDPAPRPVEAG